MRLTLDDDLLDAQLLRTVGAAPYGGADVGECLATARTVRGTDLDGWYSAWTELAGTTAELVVAVVVAVVVLELVVLGLYHRYRSLFVVPVMRSET